jgi:hypothetical protein
MFKKKLPQWSILPAEVEVTHFYGTFLVKCAHEFLHKFYPIPVPVPCRLFSVFYSYIYLELDPDNVKALYR